MCYETQVGGGSKTRASCYSLPSKPPSPVSPTPLETSRRKEAALGRGYVLKGRSILPKAHHRPGFRLSRQEARGPGLFNSSHSFPTTFSWVWDLRGGDRKSLVFYLFSGSWSSLPGPQLCPLKGRSCGRGHEAPGLRRGTAWKASPSFFPSPFSFSSSSSSSSSCALDSTAEARRVWPRGSRSPPARNTSGTSLFMGDAHRPV